MPATTAYDPSFFSALPTPAEMALWDRAAMRDFRIPEFALMENASREAFHVLRSLSNPRQTVLVLMGGGNNGGDGAALARHLRDAGYAVLVCHTSPLSRLRGAAKAHCELARRCGVPFARLDQTGADEKGLRIPYAHHAFAANAAVIVDALLGTGFKGPLRQRELALVRYCNNAAARSFVFSLDIPSGLDGLTGEPGPEAIRAHAAVTFEAAKTGLCLPQAKAYTGTLHVRPIGIPLAVRETHPPSFLLMDPAPGSRPKASPLQHKGDAGRVLVIGGSEAYTGAPQLAALGALHAGAGLVSVACPGGLAASIRGAQPEIMALPLGSGLQWSDVPLPELLRAVEELPGKSAVVLGPGLGRGKGAEALVRGVLGLAKRPPLVLDADGLFPLGQDPGSSLWNGLRETDILTPHPGEAGHLLGVDTGRVQADRPAALRALTERLAAAVVLKGSGTLVGQRGKPCALAPFASAALAVGGSGDVLSGICAAYAAKGHSAFMAACLAVYTHGKAGKILENDHPHQGALAGDIARAVTRAAW